MKIRKILILSASLLCVFTALAEEVKDSAYMALYRRYYQLFYTDSVEEFYDASEQLQKNYLKRGEVLRYYKIRQNEIFFDDAHGKSYQAIKKANKLLEDMKDSKTKHYELPYMSMGYIFETRGIYRIAVHYYQEALNNIDAQDSMGRAHIYSQLATINLTRHIDQSEKWSEQLGNVISQDSLYYRLYLTIKGHIYFYQEDRDKFLKNEQEFYEFLKRKPALDHNGEHVLKVMENALNGKYDVALHLLSQNSQDYDSIARYDIRIQIYRMMGHSDWALAEAAKRRVIRDSLNNDLLFNSLNEINASINIFKLKEKAAVERERWRDIVIILLLLACGLVVYRYLSFRHYEKKIEKQNEELEIVLDEAKESDRMKDIFIKHISHEIRTPLNIITGYAQLITNPAFELDKEERNRLVQAIGQNTAAITDIVNALLEISQEESKVRYRKDDTIIVNIFCQQMMREAEEKNKGRLSLKFKSDLYDDFTFKSNQSGIERILQQLLDNALKFTEQGQVELSAYKDPNGNMVSFAVTDTGIGIPTEEHEQVFEHFYKLDSFKHGLGVGLPMSRRIAILLGGTLSIDEDYHDGTRFVLSVPVK